MEIQKQNVIKAYNGADDNGKLMLETLFPDICFTDERKQRPIMERVKTFEDACEELGLTEQAVTEQWDNARLDMPDEVAYQKLRIICAALNEGWQPQFTEDEERWYPWFLLWTDSELSEKTEEWKRDHSLIMIQSEYVGEFAGFAYAYSHYAPSCTYASFGSRLCLKSEALADYCGRQFAALWADFYLIRK